MTRRPRRDWGLVVVMAIAVLIAVASIVYYAHKSASCRDEGGVLVKSAFGYSCVAGPGGNR